MAGANGDPIKQLFGCMWPAAAVCTLCQALSCTPFEPELLIKAASKIS
jgi:hypothetical protein